MSMNAYPVFTDSPSIRGRESGYQSIVVLTDKVIDSWRKSLFAHEWLTSDGRVREIAELSQVEQERRRETELRLRNGEPLEKPVLGIGILDNIEIGSGRSVFLTLALHGVKEISVHIPASHNKEFKPYIAGEGNADKTRANTR